jgi:hypothetical protein
MRAISTCGLVIAVIVTVGAAWATVDDIRGSDATATVVGVEHQRLKTFLTVGYTTDRGVACESSLLVRVEAHRNLGPGDRLEIHHPRLSPCLNAREAGDRSSFLGFVGLPILLTVFAVMAYRAWRPPRPPAP